MTEKQTTHFTFDISLSVLNHLGRSLYRRFATILGEAVSNAWDADAKNVWIYIDRDRGCFFIKDDGIGMSADDFQNMFLKIGYSKRKDGAQKSPKGRPFIGRKGIGKLALLSCAQKISVISKKKGEDYIGGVIDNSGLDRAITEDLSPQNYPLEQYDKKVFEKNTKNHAHGTIIYFEGIRDGIRNSFGFLQKIIALYFRFSLLDDSFNIYLNDEKITHEHLNALVKKTQFLWEIGDNNDPFISEIKKAFSKEAGQHESKTIKMSDVKGFVASVEKPRDLKIMTPDERVGVDLFVNGRLRERDLLKHIPTARIVESYLYGQIHFDKLDDSQIDRFTSSREGIVADDDEFRKFLEKLKKALATILEDWDKWRTQHKQGGDPDNPRLSPKERASRELFNAASRDYKIPKGTESKGEVDGWVDDLEEDARFNLESYVECFISENLVRKYIKKKKITFSREANEAVAKHKGGEKKNKGKANMSIELRSANDDSNYLDMDSLANLVDKAEDKNKNAALSRDAVEFKPIRDAVAHTALLTDAAKDRLVTIRENIKARLRTLLTQA